MRKSKREKQREEIKTPGKKHCVYEVRAQEQFYSLIFLSLLILVEKHMNCACVHYIPFVAF